MLGEQSSYHGWIPRRGSLALFFGNWLALLVEDKVGLREATRRSMRRAVPDLFLTSSCGNVMCRIHAAAGMIRL